MKFICLTALNIEVLREHAFSILQVEADVIDLLVRGKLQLQGLQRFIFGHCNGLLRFANQGALHGENLSLSQQVLTSASGVVHHLCALLHGVVLDMKRFARLLHTEVGSGGFEVVVVGTPYHAGPASVTHPDEETHAVLLRGLIHGAVAVVIEPL